MKLFVYIVFFQSSIFSFSQVNCSNFDNFVYDKEAEYIEGVKKFHELFMNNVFSRILFMDNKSDQIYQLIILLYIDENGEVNFEDILDYERKSIPIINRNEVDMLIKKIGNWYPAEYNSKKVGSCYGLKIMFNCL